MVDHDEYAIREGLSTKGYMKLIGRQEPTAGRYAKALQTRVDGVDGKPSFCLVHTHVWDNEPLSCTTR